jgi:proteasome beta subunit
VTDPPSVRPGESGPGLGGSWSIGANPSFLDLIRTAAPDTLPKVAQPGAPVGVAVPHGTTVLALKYRDGVMMSGDRRAVEGFTIADERIDKVFPADDTSAVAIAGAAGQATEIVRLFQTELEHYEKVEGDRLSLEGKANRLAQMIRQNFPFALQGLVVVPLFAGFDERRSEGRIFRYDVTGGRWEEADYHATGSGSLQARGTLKKRWRPGMDRRLAVKAAVEALYDASQEDVATGGPNPLRGIYPTVRTITADGVMHVPEDEVHAAFDSIVGETREAHREEGGSQAMEGDRGGPVEEGGRTAS